MQTNKRTYDLNKQKLFIAFVYLVVHTFLFQYSVYGQQNAVNIAFKKVELLIHQEQNDAAIATIQSLVISFQKHANWEDIYTCQKFLYLIGSTQNIYNIIFNELQYNHQLIPIEADTIKAKSAYLLAYVAEKIGADLISATIYRSTIESFKRHHDLSRLFGVYGNLGVFYMKTADHYNAIKYLKASIDLATTLKNKAGIALNTKNLAKAYFYNNDYEKAKSTYDTYIKLVPTETCLYHFELSKIYLQQNEFVSAKNELELAQKSSDNSFIKAHELKNLKADIYLKEGKPDSSLHIYMNLEKDYLRLTDRRERGKYYLSIANLYKKLEDWENAYDAYQKSWNAFCNNKISINNIEQLSHNSYIYHEIHIPEILNHLSDYHIAKFNQTKLEKHRIKASQCMDYIFDALDYKKGFLQNFEGPQQVNIHFTKVYEKSINIYLKWYEETHNTNFLINSFHIAQRHNAYQLRQLIKERTSLKKLKVDSILSQDYLNKKLVYLNTSFQLNDKFSNTLFDSFRISEQNFNIAKEKIGQLYPKFLQEQNDFSIPNIAEIQSGIDEKTAVIKYFAGHEKLYAFVITSNNFKYFIHDNINSIDFDVKNLRDQLSNFSIRKMDEDSLELKYMKTSLQLAKKIIIQELGTLTQEIKKLIIIPAGSLTQIPFESLVLKASNNWSDPTSYLLYDYIVSYAYFCKQISQKTIIKDLEKVLCYGLEYNDFTLQSMKKNREDSIAPQIIEKFRSNELSHIYFADDEALAIADMFNGTSFLNANATKKNFIKHVPNYDIIHVSAHSFVDFKFPEKSSIIFFKNDSLTDNLVQMKDILELDLNGQLITLSACNTFFGKNYEGEGLSSIAKSFIESGAGSVLGSFWSVPDEISKSFMTVFYSKLKVGLPKDEALRATKIQFMTDDNLISPMYRSPSHWSAWVLFGDNQEFKHKSNPYYLLLIPFLLIFLYYLVRTIRT